MFETTTRYICHFVKAIMLKGDSMETIALGPNICHHKMGSMVTQEFTVCSYVVL